MFPLLPCVSPNSNANSNANVNPDSPPAHSRSRSGRGRLLAQTLALTPALAIMLSTSLVATPAMADAPTTKSAAPTRGATSERQLVDRIVAIVNQKVITLHDVEMSASPLFESQLDDNEAGKPYDRNSITLNENQILRSTLDEMISEELIIQEANKLQIQISDSEVDQFVDNIKNQYSWSDAQLEQVIHSQGTTMAAYRNDIRRRLQSSRLVQIRIGSKVAVSESQVNEQFRRQYGTSGTETEISARHILVMLAPEASPETTALANAKIAKAAERLNSGESFADVAQDLSEGPSARRGGTLGSFRKGTMEPAFEEAAFKAELNKIVGPVRTQIGLHLIQVTGRETVTLADEADARAKIHEELYNKALQRQMEVWTSELRQKAFVEIRL